MKKITTKEYEITLSIAPRIVAKIKLAAKGQQQPRIGNNVIVEGTVLLPTNINVLSQLYPDETTLGQAITTRRNQLLEGGGYKFLNRLAEEITFEDKVPAIMGESLYNEWGIQDPALTHAFSGLDKYVLYRAKTIAFDDITWASTFQKAETEIDEQLMPLKQALEERQKALIAAEEDLIGGGGEIKTLGEGKEDNSA